MFEWDDECAARSCIRTRFSDDLLFLAAPRHSWQPSVTMMPLIAAAPLTHSTGISPAPTNGPTSLTTRCSSFFGLPYSRNFHPE